MLSDPAMGPRLFNQLLEPLWLEAFELRWRRENRSVWNWIAIASGASVLWLFISFLFLIAYWRKRRMAQLKRESFDDDDEYYSEDEVSDEE
jgi:heme/copper-type cytochrome/quinol oxidase subunit 2